MRYISGISATAVVGVRELVDRLSDSRARPKYGAAKSLMALAESQPEALYPLFDEFAALLDGPNQVLAWNAARILAHLAAVDAEGRFERIWNWAR